MTGPLGAASPWPLIEWFEGCLRGSLAFLRLRVRLIRLRRCFVGSVPFPDRLVAGLYFLLSALARVAKSASNSAASAFHRLNVRFATFRPLHGVNLRPQYGGMTSCSDEREATDCGILAGISEESGPADSCQRS